MLIIPLDRAFDWRHPPLITLLLLAANVLVFLFTQLDDPQEAITAAETYVHSGLAEIEVPYYRRYLKLYAPQKLTDELNDAADDWPGWMWLVQTDEGFQARLAEGRVIAPSSSRYMEWQRKRAAFTPSYEAITFVHYGLRTAQPSAETLFTHMFLHAGVWHLLGNALFLVAVGFLVEATLTRTVFLASYLLAGLGSAAFNLWFDPPSLVPGIGASGAIAGLMGMYAVLYGLRRIRFFYFVGVYFDYVRLPAIILLPAWIANELLQMWLYPDSNINYMAHLGGLVTGALIGLATRHLAVGYDMSHIEQEDAERVFEQSLNAARALCDRFEYRLALPELRRLYRERPDHPVLLQLYHEAARIDLASDAYHESVNGFLQAHRQNPVFYDQQVGVYRDYLARARPGPRLQAESLLAVLPALLAADQLEDAARLVTALAKRPRPDPRLPAFARALAKSLEAHGDQERARPFHALAQRPPAAAP